MTGTCGIPADAKAVAANLTIVEPLVDSSDPGYLTVWPAGTVMPLASNLNFVSRWPRYFARANTAMVGLGATGGISAKVSMSKSGTVDFLMDVFGFFR